MRISGPKGALKGLKGVTVAYISDAVRNKNGGCGAALLGSACNIGHAYTNYERHHWSKESNDSIAGYGCGSPMGPCASPDHCTASDYG